MRDVKVLVLLDRRDLGLAEVNCLGKHGILVFLSRTVLNILRSFLVILKTFGILALGRSHERFSFVFFLVLVAGQAGV